MTDVFNGISWGAYLLAAGTLTAGYYLVIGALYYRKEISTLLSGKGKPSGSMDEKEADGGDGSFEQLEAVVLDLRSNILEEAGNNVGKADLLVRLQLRLTNYDGLRHPAYRAAVNNFIIRDAAECCGVDFSEEELNRAWEALPRA